MNWKTEKRNKHPKHPRTISTVMAVAIASSLFAGIVPAERYVATLLMMYINPARSKASIQQNMRNPIPKSRAP